MSTVPASCEQRVVLRSISWDTYVVLTKEAEAGSGKISTGAGCTAARSTQ